MTDEISDYYMGIKKTQLNTAAKFGVPKYKLVNYESPEDFDNYISSPDYKQDRNNQGVCFGFEHHYEENVTASNNITMDFHYPDKRIGVSAVSYS